MDLLDLDPRMSRYTCQEKYKDNHVIAQNGEGEQARSQVSRMACTQIPQQQEETHSF